MKVTSSKKITKNNKKSKKSKKKSPSITLKGSGITVGFWWSKGLRSAAL
jgi:hypothetical protein